MTNAVKHSIKLKLKAKMIHSFGQFVAIFKFCNGQFWPISAYTLANFSFLYLVTLFLRKIKQNLICLKMDPQSLKKVDTECRAFNSV